jgi:hypothetical protein
MNINNLLESVHHLDLNELKKLSSEINIAKHNIDKKRQEKESSNTISAVVFKINGIDSDINDDLLVILREENFGSYFGLASVEFVKKPLFIEVSMDIWAIFGGAFANNDLVAKECFELKDSLNGEKTTRLLNFANSYKRYDSLAPILERCANASSEEFYGFSLLIKKGEQVWVLDYDSENYSLKKSHLEISGQVVEYDDYGFTLRAKSGKQYKIPLEDNDMRLNDKVSLKIEQPSLAVTVLSRVIDKDITQSR